MRKIIHCDCDCFYAAIEMRDEPALRGRPLAVGGASERRGVVATCNYEARRFGIHSAMPMATALRKCPQLQVVPPRMDIYRQVSAQVHAIFRDYTPLIEPLSLDEAYLDVTESSACQGSATLIAAEIRRRVREELGITLSAGIAPTKFLAKIASDWNKPDGQFVIRPNEVDDFVRALPVDKLHGVGKVTAGRLHALGIQTCEDLRAFSETALITQFGRFGTRLYQLARGIDVREVKVDRIRKSLSVETTFVTDLTTGEQCQQQLEPLYTQLLRRWQGMSSRYDITGAVVKLKFNNFVSTTAEQTRADWPLGAASVDKANGLPSLDVYTDLLAQAWERQQLPVRLIGLGVRLRPHNSGDEQLTTQLALLLE